MKRTLASTKGRLSAVILAAGGSERLGRPKQLLRYRGIPLVLGSVRLARASVAGPVVVVLGDQRQRLRSLLIRHGKRLVVVNNARWTAGLATSLRAGLDAVPANVRAALVMLIDQPGLSPSDIARLVAAWHRRPTKPAAARYDGRVGVPAVIPRRWFRELSALRGDTGARHVLRRLPDVTPVDMPAASFDVDTPADAAALASNTPCA